MKLKSIYLYLVAITCLWLMDSCIKEDVSAVDGDSRSVSMAMNISTRAGSEMQESVENTIQSLRVYAFLGENQIGYYYTDNVTTDEQGKVPFVMDLALPSHSTVSSQVRFYLVANEEAVESYQGSAWSEEMTRQALEDYRFRELDPTATRTTLPMALVQDVAIDPKNVHESTEPGHTGHWMWSGSPIAFQLERAVAKLGMFFAKKDDVEGGELVINRIEMLPEGLRDYNYMFAPTDEKLQAVLQSGQNGFTLLATPLTVDKTVTDDSYDPNPEDLSQLAILYTDALSAPAYMFENCYGSNNPNTWGTADTDHKGFVLRVTYSVNGNQSQKDIYLPSIKRNTYYYVLNRIDAVKAEDVTMSLAVRVAAWDEETIDVPPFN